jgi:hypothetical protein
MFFRNLSYLYIGAAFLIGAVSTYKQIQPALFWIDIFAPNAGDTYSIKIVAGLTILTLLLPLLLIMMLVHLIRKSIDTKAIKNVDPGQTGIWVNRKASFQSAFVDIPFYINNTRISMIYNGANKFFPQTPGPARISAGKGKRASGEITFDLKKGQQVRTELEVVVDGLLTRLDLKEII